MSAPSLSSIQVARPNHHAPHRLVGHLMLIGELSQGRARRLLLADGLGGSGGELRARMIAPAASRGQSHEGNRQNSPSPVTTLIPDPEAVSVFAPVRSVAKLLIAVLPICGSSAQSERLVSIDAGN